MARKSTRTNIPVGEFLRGRGKRRWTYTAVTLMVALLLLLADRSGLLLETGDDVARYDGKWFTVVRVVDGDTLDIDAPDGDEATTRVRLWGVDTPEMARRDPPRPSEPFAEEAAEFTRRLVEGQKVRLALEPHRQRGDYGRLLAFVELSDGTVLNEALILEGLSRADGRWSHSDLSRYAKLEREAKDAGMGLWGR